MTSIAHSVFDARDQRKCNAYTVTFHIPGGGEDSKRHGTNGDQHNYCRIGSAKGEKVVKAEAKVEVEIMEVASEE